jgi:hypothetical protein
MDAKELEKVITMFYAKKYRKQYVRGYAWSTYNSLPSTYNIFTKPNLLLLKKCNMIK